MHTSEAIEHRDHHSAKKILIAQPRGFCAGVDRAVRSVQMILDNSARTEQQTNSQELPPVYVRREIVHNRHVVEHFEQQGVVFVEALQDIPQAAAEAAIPVVFSAHGVSPEVRREALARQLYVVDATCPLVSKVHREVLRYAKLGYHIVYIAQQGHDEAIGVVGEAPDRIHLVESIEDVDALRVSPGTKLVCLTQTTLSVDETAELQRHLRKRFPAVEMPPSADICYATQDRQFAVKQLAEASDAVIVIGSDHSSNTRQLLKVAQDVFDSKMDGIHRRAHRIDRAQELQQEWLRDAQIIGLSSGASAPESLIQEVIKVLENNEFHTIEVIGAAEQHTQFALPAPLR